MKIEQNISRLKYLLSLYKLTEEQLLLLLNTGVKKSISRDDVFSKNIKVSNLKKIDKVFNKGLHYYLDPKSPQVSKDASIFFRKTTFNTDLNIGAKKIVNQFEDFKISLSAISKLAELNINRILPIYSINDDAKTVANNISKFLYPRFNADPKEFLKSLISKFAENNILVFEFVETWNKKDKANIDGFYLTPNVIVLKRQQSSFRREIFTVIHELGHYLINEEEIEAIDVSDYKSLNKIEKWCNDFAYFFLAGSYDEVILDLENAGVKNDFHFELFDKISAKTHLSQIALFTRMLFLNKISGGHYGIIKADIEESYRKRLEEDKKKRELDKLNGIKSEGRAAKPINSPLLISTLQTAFYEGVISEYDVIERLKISPDKLRQILL